MDFRKELQRRIIAGVLGEATYRLAAFLEKNDFVDYDDARYRTIWGAIKKADGNYLATWRNLTGIGLYPSALVVSSTADYSRLDLLGLMLLEENFKSYLSTLIDSITGTSSDAKEIEALNEIKESIADTDVFVITQTIEEYLSPVVSDSTIKRVRDWTKYVDDRSQKVKKSIK